jgi:hypothetical protein
MLVYSSLNNRLKSPSLKDRTRKALGNWLTPDSRSHRHNYLKSLSEEEEGAQAGEKGTFWR